MQTARVVVSNGSELLIFAEKFTFFNHSLLPRLHASVDLSVIYSFLARGCSNRKTHLPIHVTMEMHRRSLDAKIIFSIWTFDPCLSGKVLADPLQNYADENNLSTYMYRQNTHTHIYIYIYIYINLCKMNDNTS